MSPEKFKLVEMHQKYNVKKIIELRLDDERLRYHERREHESFEQQEIRLKLIIEGKNHD